MLSKKYSIVRLDDSDADDILDFCRKNTLYYQYCGAETSKEQVLNDLHITPPGVDTADNKPQGFDDKEKKENGCLKTFSKSMEIVAKPLCRQAQGVTIGTIAHTAFAVSIWTMNRETGQQTVAA